jgi:hypothetical protein
MLSSSNLKNDVIFIIDHNTPVQDPVEQEIWSFSNLPEGWDYGQGSPPSAETIDKAIVIYRIGKKYNLSVEVLPLGDGEIIVSFSQGETFIDILIGEGETYRLSVEIGIGDKYEIGETINNAPINVIEDKLKKLSGFDKWNLSESSENDYSAAESSASGENVSEIWGERFLWWIANASSGLLRVQPANI